MQAWPYSAAHHRASARDDFSWGSDSSGLRLANLANEYQLNTDFIDLDVVPN